MIKPIKINFYAKFILLAIGTLINFPYFATNVNAYNYDPEVESIFHQMYRDNGEGWICFWEFGMPDRDLDSPDCKIVPGPSGFSKIDFNSIESEITMNVNGFLNDYILPIKVSTNGSIDLQYGIQLTEWRTADNETAGCILPAGAKSQIASDYAYIFNMSGSTINNYNTKTSKAIYISDISKYNEDGVRISLSDETNYIMFQEWTGGDLFKNINGNITLNGKIYYFNDLSLYFYKPTVVSTGTLYKNGEISQTYPVFAKQTDNKISITNLYNLGQEYMGDIWGYFTSVYDINKSSVNVTLHDNNIAVLESNLPGMMRKSLLQNSSKPTGTNDGIKEIEFKMNDSYTPYTDYIIVGEEDQNIWDRQNDFFQKDDWDIFSQEASSKHLQGSYEFRQGDNLINQHWDGENGYKRCLLSITFPTHYIAEVMYPFLKGTPSSAYYVFYNRKSPYPIKIDELSIDIPSFEANKPPRILDFELLEYGNGLVYDTDTEYVCIMGNLISEFDNSKTALYIVRGEITDYFADRLNDTENGCAESLKIYGDGITEFDMLLPKEPAGITALSEPASSSIKLFVPKDRIPGNFEADESEIYTLYARYEDTDGSTRFRNLTTLSASNLTTTTADDLFSDSRPFYRVSGNTITAASSSLEIFDMTGRHIKTISNGQSAKLASGLYIVRGNNNSAQKIIIR